MRKISLLIIFALIGCNQALSQSGSKSYTNPNSISEVSDSSSIPLGGDVVDATPTPTVSPTPPPSSPVTLTVRDLLFVGALDEVRRVFMKTCLVERMYFMQRKQATGVGEYRRLLPTTPLIPGIDTSPSSSAEWDQMGIIPIGTPLLFQFEVEASGTGDNATYRVIARGDLDGDNVASEIFTKDHNCLEFDGTNPTE